MIDSPPPDAAGGTAGRRVPSTPARRRGWWWPVGLLLATAACYFGCIDVPFQFDDQPAVLYNQTLRDGWPSWGMLHPPADAAGATGRPVVNATLALNYALGGANVRGYHLFNLLLHVLVALTLWSLIRRTMRLMSPAPGVSIDAVAVTAAGLWAVHPLLTESVVCIVQRNEELVALFFLLTLYAVNRSATTRTPLARRSWAVTAVSACALGMASKEVMVTAPLVAWLYDRTFLAGSFRGALRARRTLYGGLALTWVLLAWLVLNNAQRAGTVGFGLGITSWDYLLTQGRALVLYLKLAIWPHPLVVDYGSPVVHRLSAVWWQASVVLALLGATIWALVRRPAAGFLGACFFLLLAPSSSFVPLTTQTIAEHRMYLPLAVLVLLVVLALRRLPGALTETFCFACFVALAFGTIRRITVYRTEMSLWTETVKYAPDNPRAHLNLGQALLTSGNAVDAVQQFETAFRVRPDYAEAHYNLGLALSQQGRLADAAVAFKAALDIVPDYTIAHNALGTSLAQAGEFAAALEQFDQALGERPDFLDAQVNRARVLVALHRGNDAIADYQQILRRHPDSAAAHLGLGDAWAANGTSQEAIKELRAAVQQEPRLVAAQFNLANLLSADGRLAEAVPHYAAAAQEEPNKPALQIALANALMRLGQSREAALHYTAAVELQPNSAELRLNLALALAASGRLAEAIEQCQTALRLRPGFGAAEHYLNEMRSDLQKSASRP